MSIEALVVVLAVSSAFAILRTSLIATGIAVGTAVILLIAHMTGLPL